MRVQEKKYSKALLERHFCARSHAYGPGPSSLRSTFFKSYHFVTDTKSSCNRVDFSERLD